MFEKFKKWAYEVPTFESPVWDRVDVIVDRDLEFMFNNKYVAHMVEDVDRAITWLENKASAIQIAIKEAQ